MNFLFDDLFIYFCHDVYWYTDATVFLYAWTFFLVKRILGTFACVYYNKCLSVLMETCILNFFSAGKQIQIPVFCCI